MWTAPVAVKEPVRAIPRNRHGFQSPADRLRLRDQRGTSHRGELGEIVANQPETMVARRVPLKDHHTTGDATHLLQAGDRIAPVVIGENRHRNIERAVGERERLRFGGDAARGIAGTLCPHHGRRLDGGENAVPRLVGPGSGAHIQDGVRISERTPDAGSDSGFGAALSGVRVADLVI
jgi:hypothetical protein